MHTPRINAAAPFTKRLVAQGVFRDAPFCLVDVGVSGGIDSYWSVFGEDLQVIGFDPLVKEVERLNAAAFPRERYFAFFVGDRTFRKPDDSPNMQPFGRTSAWRAIELTKYDYAKIHFDQTGSGESTSETIELDQFFADHPMDIDFIKTDTDGSDYQVLRGARGLLGGGGILGLAVECLFHGYARGESDTFRHVDTLLASHGFSLFDLETYRYSRAALPKPFTYRLFASTHTGQLMWGDALFLRDAGDQNFERDWSLQLSPIKTLKLACLFELFGLEDCAVELLLKYRQMLAPLTDINAALDDLTPSSNGSKSSYASYLQEFEKDPATFFPPG